MSFFTFKHVPPSATSGHWILGLLCGGLCGHLVPLVSPVRTRPAGRKQLVRYNCSSGTLGAGFLLTLPPGTASSLLWVGQSLGTVPVGVHSCASRDPLLSAGQRVCDGETTGEPSPATCPRPPGEVAEAAGSLDQLAGSRLRSCWWVGQTACSRDGGQTKY